MSLIPMFFAYYQQKRILGAGKLYSINTTFIGCSITTLETYGTAPLFLKDCTINLLKYGIICYEGLIKFNQSGFSGTGKYTNMTYINNCVILSNKLSYFIANNTAEFIIQNVSSLIPYIFALNNATIEIKNSIFEKLYAFENNTIICNNALGIEILCHGNVSLIFKEASNCAISMFDCSRVNVTNSICSVFINNKAVLIISSNSVIETITIFATNNLQCSCNIYDSKVNNLNIYGWD